MKKRRTPQEKKSLSYANDRRNAFGENDKGSRKSIRLNKVKPMRAYRRNVNQVLQSETSGIELEGAEQLQDKVKEARRRKWRKWPDMPLGEIVKGNLERRAENFGARLRRKANHQSQTGEDDINNVRD